MYEVFDENYRAGFTKSIKKTAGNVPKSDADDDANNNGVTDY